MRMELPKDIMFISSLYKKAGKELYVVGGAVRDHIRGLSPKDYDLATNAKPEETESILAPHFHIIGVGKSFGVMVAITPEFPDGVEIATFREDTYNAEKTLDSFLEYLNKEDPMKKKSFMEILKISGNSDIQDI